MAGRQHGGAHDRCDGDGGSRCREDDQRCDDGRRKGEPSSLCCRSWAGGALSRREQARRLPGVAGECSPLRGPVERLTTGQRRLSRAILIHQGSLWLPSFSAQWRRVEEEAWPIPPGSEVCDRLLLRSANAESGEREGARRSLWSSCAGRPADWWCERHCDRRLPQPHEDEQQGDDACEPDRGTQREPFNEIPTREGWGRDRLSAFLRRGVCPPDRRSSCDKGRLFTVRSLQGVR